MEENLKGHFINLYLIALSDNDFDERELETILQIGQEKGITREEFEQIIINPTSVEFYYPDDFKSKINMLYDYVRVIDADDVVTDEEKRSFLFYCKKFNFETEESNELFEWLIDKSRRNFSQEQIEKELETLIN